MTPSARPRERPRERLRHAEPAGANFGKLAYFVNVDKQAHAITAEALKGLRLQLHPAHLDTNAGDTRAAQAQFDIATGMVTVPARTAVVFVTN
jgi:hypothetical protein